MVSPHQRVPVLDPSLYDLDAVFSFLKAMLGMKKIDEGAVSQFCRSAAFSVSCSQDSRACNWHRAYVRMILVSDTLEVLLPSGSLAEDQDLDHVRAPLSVACWLNINPRYIHVLHGSTSYHCDAYSIRLRCGSLCLCVFGQGLAWLGTSGYFTF